MAETAVSELWIYPVKSCRGVQVEEVAAVDTGFELDREFMIVNADGSFMTQRQHPEMAAIAVEVIADSVEIACGGLGTVALAREYASDGKRIGTAVHGNPCVGIDQGDEPAQLLSRFFDEEVRLIRAAREDPRFVKERYWHSSAPNLVAFGDSFPLLLTSERSLVALNEGVSDPLPMNRFRPNIVVDGTGLEPFDEDGWRLIRIGDMGAKVVRACARCVIPGIEQVGERAGSKTHDVLRGFLASRKGFDLTKPDSTGKDRFFGQNILHLDQVKVRVGDKVSVKIAGLPNVRIA